MSLRRSRLLAVASACVVITTLAACNATDSPDAAPEAGSASGSATPGESESPEIPPVKVLSNVDRGARDVPVDTHVSRVGMRLRLLRPGAPFVELHDTMLAITPPGEELELHLRASRNTGATPDEIREALLHVAVYAGVPAANSAIALAKTIFADEAPR